MPLAWEQKIGGMLRCNKSRSESEIDRLRANKCNLSQLSRVIPDFCICENNDAYLLHSDCTVTARLISAYVFAT